MRIFHGSKLKTERARSHIDALATEVSSYSLSSPCYLVLDDDSDPGFKVFKLKRTRPIPENIFLIIGDAVHNLRSALDHLAYELVEIETSKTGKKLPENLVQNIQFPIAKASNNVNQAIKSKQMNEAGKLVVNALRALRPYPKGNDGLYALHELDRLDKHRLIIPVIEVTATPYISTIIDSAPDGGTFTVQISVDEPIEFDKELHSFAAPEDPFRIPSNSFAARGSFPPISIDVGLPIEPFKGVRVVDWLRKMANYLDGVIAAFESLLGGKAFKPPDPIIPISKTGLIVK